VSDLTEPEPAPPRPPASGVPHWLVVAAGISWRLVVVAAAIVVAVAALARLRLAVLPLIVALIAATLLEPPVRWLRRRGLPPALATILVLGAALAAFVGLMSVLIPQIGGEIADVGDDLQQGWEDLLDWLGRTFGIGRRGIDDLLARAAEQVRANATRITLGVLAGAALVGEFLVGLVLTIVVLFFFLKDGERLTAWLLERIPTEHRGDVQAAGGRAWETLAGYLRGSAIVATVDAVGIGIGLLLIGVPLVAPLMLLTFFGGFFPIIGATVAGLLAVLVALVAGSVVDALLTLAVVVAVQQLESNILEPVVMARVLALHPVVIMVALTSGAILGGIVGAFLAVPIAAVAAAVGNELRLRREGEHLLAKVEGD
jgi:putative heme transporter